MRLMEATLQPKEGRHGRYRYLLIFMMQQEPHTYPLVSIHLTVKDQVDMAEGF